MVYYLTNQKIKNKNKLNKFKRKQKKHFFCITKFIDYKNMGVQYHDNFRISMTLCHFLSIRTIVYKMYSGKKN